MPEPRNASTLLAEALNLPEGGCTNTEVIEMMRNLVRLESALRAAMSHVWQSRLRKAYPKALGTVQSPTYSGPSATSQGERPASLRCPQSDFVTSSRARSSRCDPA
jgi:hypothetical protein